LQVSSFEWTDQLQAVLLLIRSESISPLSSRLTSEVLVSR